MLRRLPFATTALTLLLGVATVSGQAFSAAAVECGVPTPSRGKKFELGLLYYVLVPSGLPDLTRTVPITGAVIGVPVFHGTLQLEGFFGSDPTDSLDLQMAEANYRLEVEIPYFNLFALFGAHYLHYTKATTPHSGFGANTGIGVSFLMGQNFELALSLRAYIQQRTTIGVGGGFSYLL